MAERLWQKEPATRRMARMIISDDWKPIYFRDYEKRSC